MRAPSSYSRSLALRFARPPALDQCSFSMMTASQFGFGTRRARGSNYQSSAGITPTQQRIQCRSYTTNNPTRKLPSGITSSPDYVNFLMPKHLQQSGRGRGPEAGSMVAGKRRASGGLMDLLFGRKSKKYMQRQENVSSRYLDSGAEEAILGRSLLQKTNGDEFLRCTEFDKEGSQLRHQIFC